MDKPKFVYVSYISTTAEKLWEALTSGEFTRQYWWGRQVRAEWRAGGRFEMVKPGGDIDFHGEVLECDPPRKLVYSFDPVDPKFRQSNESPSRVSYELEPEEGAIKLTVRHEGFEPGSKIFESIQNGWPALLSGLKTLLESGRSMQFAVKQLECTKQ